MIDRPLITFALFGYNHETFICEAIEGAFSQTYEPLEIILSDDCSSDRTFEIMERMAAAYHGPHQLLVRRNQFNIGTSLHVQFAFAQSSGQLFVLAAGDDISKPDRVSVLCRAWTDAGRPEGAVQSGREAFEAGKPDRVFKAKSNKYRGRELEGYARSHWLPAAAPTCAYTRAVFDRFGPLPGGSLIEDAPLQLRAALIGRFISTDEPLVRQRVHDQNTGTGFSFSSVSRWNRFMQSKIVAFRTMQVDLAAFDGGIDRILRQRIERRILAVLNSAGGLLLPETERLNRLGRVGLMLRIATSPAVTGNFISRMANALSFIGFSFHTRWKARVNDGLAGKTSRIT